MNLPSPVPFEEYEDSPVSERGAREGGFEFVRRFTTSYDGRLAFMAYLLTGNNGGPLPYPGAFNLFVDEVTIERIVDRPTSATQYEFTDASRELIHHGEQALHTVTYTPIVQDNPNDPPTGGGPGGGVQLPDGTYVRYSRRSSVEFYAIPSRSLKFETSGNTPPADAHPLVPVSLVDHVVEWFRVVDPPWDAIDALKGTVNATTFRIPGTDIHCAPETLLFDVEEDDVDFATSDLLAVTTGSYVPVYKLKYTFKQRTIKTLTASAVRGVAKGGPLPGSAVTYGWNHAWDPGSGGWDRLVDEAAGSKPLFQANDFTDLFKLGAVFPG